MTTATDVRLDEVERELRVQIDELRSATKRHEGQIEEMRRAINKFLMTAVTYPPARADFAGVMEVIETARRDIALRWERVENIVGGVERAAESNHLFLVSALGELKTMLMALVRTLG